MQAWSNLHGLSCLLNIAGANVTLQLTLMCLNIRKRAVYLPIWGAYTASSLFIFPHKVDGRQSSVQ